ncbi:MAG: helix-turn-helix domain-containing protein [Verrucomicrobiales bacterium]|jgi:transcriptional regulator with XRE-family HTH domain|nr:helix-turn-helix domain-containing protein [Verrucomicrobiales bacterium]
MRTLDRQLAHYLKINRGKKTIAEFALLTGLSPSTIFRLENCQQSATLRTFTKIMHHLNQPLPKLFDLPHQAPKTSVAEEPLTSHC